MGIGREGVKDTLNLITGEDWKWSFQWAPDGKTPEAFPAGLELFIELGPEKTKWPFVIEGVTASIKVESEVADLIEAGTAFWLKTRRSSVTPADDSVIAYGQVKRFGPR